MRTLLSYLPKLPWRHVAELGTKICPVIQASVLSLLGTAALCISLQLSRLYCMLGLTEADEM